MPATIYYFSATGNSLWIARSLARGLDPCELVPMARIWRCEHIRAPAGAVGFVFPMYFYGIPDIVERFLTRFEPDSADYLFAVVTRGGAAGCSLQRVGDLLAARGRELDVGFYVDMPGNLITLHDALPKDKQQKVLAEAERKVGKIIGVIARRGRKGERDKPLVKKIALGKNRSFLEGVHGKDAAFNVDRDCISCGFCARICPMENILMAAGRPHWQHQCQQCLACLNWCPKGAIQYRRRTEGRKRYHHPEVTFKDIESQKWQVTARRVPVRKEPG